MPNRRKKRSAYQARKRLKWSRRPLTANDTWSPETFDMRQLGELPLRVQLAQIIANSVHPIRPVADEPFTVMTRWRMLQVKRLDGSHTRHLVGWADNEGRVCSAIQKFDLAAMRFTTQSGRVYEVVGDSGIDMDAMWVWKIWMKRSGATEPQDVTDELLASKQDLSEEPASYGEAPHG